MTTPPDQIDALFRQAVDLHRAGNLGGAIEIYGKLAPQLPQNAQLLYLLGLAHFQSGEFSAAAETLGASLAANPDNPDTHNVRGAAFQSLNRQTEALQCFESAIRLKPDHSELHNNRGVVLQNLGRLDEALESFDRAIRLKAENPEAHYNRGNALRDLGRLDEALLSYDRAVQLRPDHAQAFNNRGAVLKDLGRADEALQSYDRAIALNPNYAEVYSNGGAALLDLKRVEEALFCFDRSIELNPNSAAAHNGRGNALQNLRRHDEALESFGRAIALNPGDAEAYSNRGNALQDLRRMDDAILSYERAVELNPNYAEAHNNRGFALQALRRFDEALRAFDRAIELNPTLADALFNKALLKLLLGDFDDGWALWEWRWSGGVQKEGRRPFTQPLWLGDEPINGKTILVYAEQGLGDVIQFCRYLPGVAAHGAKIIFEVPASLASLTASLACAATIVPSGDPLPPFDVQVPIMSLPLAFMRAGLRAPGGAPYLKPDPEKSERWRTRLGPKTKPRIGLVWSGGFRPNQPGLWATNERRNIPLSLFEALNIPGVEFISLQKGDDALAQLASLEQAAWRGPRILNYADALNDFADTAALIDQLDLVISVDTSTAHLAGGLGKPVWILNRFDTCWRWMLDREDSPWYPSARIFRQPAAGDWHSVIRAVKGRLEEFVRPA